MRNLKRTLSLALAALMLMGMMVVSAGAASKDFTDKDEIKHSEAVEVMVALNVISGKNDGSYFDPNGTLTREEMAKVISFVMNGGVEPVVGTKVTPTYSDIKGIWSEKYIEYCTSMGIINGDGAGKFNPTGTLTAEQAAKMFLTAMGYNANVFGFTGNSWAINVGRYANEAGLYKNLGDVVPSQPISRDDACQMAYNAIQATMMKRTWTQDLQTGELTESYQPWVENGVSHTLLGEKFDGAIKVGFLTGYNYDSNKKTWTYSFAANTAFGTTITVTNPITVGSLKSSVDYTGLFGQQVKVIYDTTTNDVVYGIYANESKVLAEGYTGNLPSSIAAADESISFAGTTYKLDSTAATTGVYNTNNATKVNDLKDLNNTSALASVRLIDNDSDTKVDAVVVTPHTVAKVSYVGTTSITVDSGIGAHDLDDIAIYNGVAKDDYVLYTASARSATQVPTFEKLDVATGTITGTKAGNNFLVDGEWLVNTTGTTLNVNDTINYIALGGRIYYAKVTTSGSTGADALAMVYNVGIKAPTGVTGKSLEASMIFSDGTKKTVTIDKVNGVDVATPIKNSTLTDEVTNIGSTGTAKNGTTIANNTLSNLLVGELVTFKVNDDGNYDVWNLTDGTAYAAPTGSDIVGYDGVTAGNSTYTYASNSVGGKEVAGDAVVFVYVGTAHTASSSNKAYVYSGKEIKNTGANYGTAGYTTYGNAVYGKVNGFTYAQAMVLGAATKPNVVTGTNYGYLVADAYTSKENGKNYVNYSYWNGTAVVTGKSEGSNIDGFKAGAVITFDDAGEGLMKNVSVPLTLTTGKVTGWDGSKKISLDNYNYELSSDTVIFYIDSENKSGKEGDIGIIAEAADVDTTVAGIENNVRYIGSGTKDVALLVVDINNYMKPAPSMVVSNVTDAVNVLATNGSVTIDGTVASSNEAALLAATTAGRTLTISGNFNAPASSISLAGNLVVTGTFTTNASGFTVLNGASLKVGALAGTAGQLTAVSGATIEVGAPNAAAMGILENASVKQAGVKVILGASTNATAGSTWYTYAGKDKVNGAANTGAAGTAIASGSSVPAGIYVCGTVYTDNNGTTSTGWVLQ